MTPKYKIAQHSKPDDRRRAPALVRSANRKRDVSLKAAKLHRIPRSVKRAENLAIYAARAAEKKRIAERNAEVLAAFRKSKPEVAA